MELYYENSEGEILDFTKAPYLARDISELLDYDWKYVISGKRIKGFEKEIAEIPMIINVLADTTKEYTNYCNELFDITETDVLKNVKGRLYYEGQYVLCNLVGSKKKDWCMGVDFQMNYMRLVTDSPFWITEKKYSFPVVANIATLEEENYLKYPFNYPYNYKSDAILSYLKNDHISACDFKMIIYGPCTNPKIYISDNIYEIETTLQESDYIVITSNPKRVIKYLEDGSTENIANSRNKKYNIFAKIPPGNNIVNRNGTFGLDVIIYQERSEPRWNLS